jgi:signal transduction histidine kinase
MGELAEGKLAGSIHEASFHASMALEECTELMNQAELRERYGPPIEKAREQWVRTEAAAMAMGKLRDAWRIDLQRGFEEGARVAGRVETVSRPLGGEDMVMLYRLVTVEGSDRPVLLAVLLNSQALRREMLDILRDAFESEPDVNSTLTDASGTVILSRMSPAGSSRYEVRRAMAPAFPSWKLMLVYRNNGPLLAAEAVERRTWLSYIALLTVIIFMGMHITYRSIRKDSELARLKSDFVSRVSHELRTPLATIRAVGEMLEIGAVSSREKEKEYFSFITSESERLSRLIDNVLDFSRLGAGKKMYHIKPIPLAKTVSATVRAFKQYVTSEGFEILYAADDDIPLVPADEDSISQALINLMDNAVKFSRDEKVVWVELRRRGDEIALRVRDRGIGIAAKDMDKIFSLFYRQDNATTVSSKGAGIGLAIVKSIAEAHGGWVEVQSVPGEGSTFTIVLPIR